MTMHEFTNHSSQTGSLARTPGRAARLVLALAVGVMAFSPWSSTAQAPADKSKKTGLAYDVHQSIELGGHVVSNSGSEAMWSTMVNTQSGPRMLNQSLTMHSTDRHKTPFFDNLNSNSFGYGGDPYAGTFLRMDKGKAYKLDASFLRNRQYFNYDLFSNSLIPDNAVPYVPILDSPHLFNTVRKTGDINLTVLPLSRFSGRAAFWRTVNEGPSFSSNVSKSNSNPLLDQWWRYSNDIYTGGVDWKLAKRTILSYDQFVTSFKQDTTWNLNKFEYQLADGTPVSQGLNIFTTAANTCIVSGTENTVIPKCNATLAYHRYMPTRTLLASEQIRFTSASIPHVTMNGRFLYSDGQLNINRYDEGYSGWSDSSINTSGRNIIRYAGVGANSHLGTLPRINVSADYGITAQITHKIEFSDIFDFRSFRDNDVTQPYQQTQFGTSLANTSNFYSSSLCPPPYTSKQCPLHTPKTAADITQGYRQAYFGQESTTNSTILSYSPVDRLKLSLGFRYRDRTIRKTLQTTTTSTFTPPFANRGACANVPLNPDGTCTVTPASVPSYIENNEIHEYWGLFGVAAQPMKDLNVKVNAEAMSADESFTQISPRQLQHYIVRTFYKPRPWMNFSGAVNILESRDNVTYVHHLAHARDYSVGASFQPDDKWSLDLNYSYDDDYSRTDVCYYSTDPMPGAGACEIPGSVANVQPFLGNGYYNYPTQFGSIGFWFNPTRKLRLNAGYLVTAADGSAETLNNRQVAGSLQSKYDMPFADATYVIGEGWEWKGGWNYYGYDEKSPVGPTLPRDFTDNVFSASVRYSF
jgi:hypothetical protein